MSVHSVVGLGLYDILLKITEREQDQEHNMGEGDKILTNISERVQQNEANKDQYVCNIYSA